MTDTGSTPRQLPLNVAANLLAVTAGALLLCSQLTLIEVSPGLFSVTGDDLDGTQLADREFRLIGLIWPALALGTAILAGLRRSATAISVGVGVLMLTASHGVLLLAAYIDQYGFGTPPAGDGVRPTVVVVGVFSIAALALAVWWIVELVRHGAATTGAVPLRVLGVIAFAVSLLASVVSAARISRDFDIPLWPSLTGSVYVLIGAAALLTGARAGLVLAAAVAAARLAATFDLVVVRGLPWSIVAETTADLLVIAGLAVALVCALLGLFPPLDAVRTGAGSLRSKLELADEWDD